MSRSGLRLVWIALGAIALVVSAMVPWRRSGAGSTYNGIDLALALRRLPNSPGWTAWAAAGLIAVPLIGSLTLVTLAAARPAVAAARTLLAATIVSCLAVLAFGGSFPLDDWSIGPVVASIGAVALVAAGAPGTFKGVTR